MKLKLLAFLLFSVQFLSACSVVDWMTYKLPISQGNFIEQRDVDLLKSGMTPEQVVFVLGQPLAKSSFEGARWEYSFRSVQGDTKLGDKRFVVFFKEGVLAAAGGDFTVPEGLEKREL